VIAWQKYRPPVKPQTWLSKSPKIVLALALGYTAGQVSSPAMSRASSVTMSQSYDFLTSTTPVP
jgi:hypothetical protein